MTKTYRLEFNEEKQKFHLDNYDRDTPGWETVFEHCSDLEWRIFESYVHRIPKSKLTNKYVFDCANEIQIFMKNLIENNISFDLKYKL
jgi:hypothetical protein